jgi:type IV secretory pathway VirB10-like protein
MQRTMNELVAACRDVSPEPTRSAPCKATNDLIEQEPCQRMETGESLAVSVAQEPPLQPPRSLSASGVNQHQQDQTETERSQHPPRSSLTPRMPLSYSTHLPLSHPSHPQLPGTTTSTSSTSRRYYEYPPPPAESHAWHSQQQQQQQSTERRDTRARIDSSSPSKRTSPPPQQVLPTAAESVRTNGCTCKKSRYVLCTAPSLYSYAVS